MLSWEIRSNAFLEIELRNAHKNVPLTCQFRAKLNHCRFFQEIGGSFSNQMYPMSLRKVVRQLMGKNSLRPLGYGFLGMRDAMTRNHVCWKLSDMFLARPKICASGNARSISAVTPSGLDLPYFNLAKHCQTSRGETSISWAPLSKARRHSRIRSFLAPAAPQTGATPSG